MGDFHRLGIAKMFPISAEHAGGVDDLMDAVVEQLPNPVSTENPQIAEEIEGSESATSPDESSPTEVKVAIIGHPNVGKSTLLNTLTSSDRAIVSPIPGTTRDAIDELVEHNGQRFRFIDTAGIRRKGKTRLMAEKLSVVMARKHLEAADIALLVIDAAEGVTGADATIGGYAHESGRSVIVIVNKWDLVGPGRKDGRPPADRELYEKQARRALKF